MVLAARKNSDPFLVASRYLGEGSRGTSSPWQEISVSGNPSDLAYWRKRFYDSNATSVEPAKTTGVENERAMDVDYSSGSTRLGVR